MSEKVKELSVIAMVTVFAICAIVLINTENNTPNLDPPNLDTIENILVETSSNQIYDFFPNWCEYDSTFTNKILNKSSYFVSEDCGITPGVLVNPEELNITKQYQVIYLIHLIIMIIIFLK